VTKRMPTLWVFIEQYLARGSKWPNNSWVTCHGFAHLYVRITSRVIGDEKLAPVLDLANMEAREPGKGAFGNMFRRLRAEHPHLHIYVEQTHERFGAHLFRLGFLKLDPYVYGDSYIYKAG